MLHQSDWKLLCSLYEYKSITKASQSLFLTQPAVTRRLGQLEEEFGVAIAIRHSKGLLFTPEGEFLVEHARRMVQEYQSLERVLRSSGNKGRLFGTLHIASSSSLARFLLPGLLGDFKRAYPEIDFVLTSEFSFKVSQRVNTQKAHVGFLRGDYRSGCQKILLGCQQARVVCSHPFHLEDLPDMPRIDFYADALSVVQIDDWWYSNFSVPPRTAITVQSGSTCAEMAANGLGYAIFLTEDFIQGREHLHSHLLYHPDGTPILRNDWLIYREEFMQMDIVSTFIRHVQKYVNLKKAVGDI